MNLKKASNRTTQLNIGGNIIDSDKEIAQNFNNFFANVGANTEDLIPKVPNISLWYCGYNVFQDDHRMFTFGEVVTVYDQLIPITVSVCSLVHMVTCIYHVTLVIYMFVELAMCRTLIQKYREIRSTQHGLLLNTKMATRLGCIYKAV